MRRKTPQDFAILSPDFVYQFMTRGGLGKEELAKGLYADAIAANKSFGRSKRRMEDLDGRKLGRRFAELSTDQLAELHGELLAKTGRIPVKNGVQPGQLRLVGEDDFADTGVEALKHLLAEVPPQNRHSLVARLLEDVRCGVMSEHAKNAGRLLQRNMRGDALRLAIEDRKNGTTSFPLVEFLTAAHLASVTVADHQVNQSRIESMCNQKRLAELCGEKVFNQLGMRELLPSERSCQEVHDMHLLTYHKLSTATARLGMMPVDFVPAVRSGSSLLGILQEQTLGQRRPKDFGSYSSVKS